MPISDYEIDRKWTTVTVTICVSVLVVCIATAVTCGTYWVQTEWTKQHEMDMQLEIKQIEAIQQIISENPDALLLDTPLGDFVPSGRTQTRYKFMPYENSWSAEGWGACYEWADCEVDK